MGSVTVKPTGQGSTATAASALRRACRRTASSAVAGGNANAASVSAPFLEHLGTSVRNAQHVEMSVALQGKFTLMPTLQKYDCKCGGFCQLFRCG